jgi:hypothetical protein
MLSGDADGHVVEPATLPLVFAMKRLRLLTPLQSCGGRLGPDGAIVQPPYVRFTCGDPV